MLSMKSVASALVLAASAADLAAPLLVAPALVLGLSTMAHAAEAPAQSVRREVVSYRDLNLATPSGKAVLQARLREAAETVCGPAADVRSFAETVDYQDCMTRAVRSAQSSLPAMRQEASRPSHAG